MTNAPAAADGHGLKRELRDRHVSMISIGGIIGGGLFVGSSVALHAAGPAAVFSYMLAGLIVVLIMRMLAEMSLAKAGTVSFAEYARAGLGPLGGYLVGWLYWYFWIMVVPYEAIVGAKILHAWIPLPDLVIGLGLMGIMTGVNLMSAKSYAEFEFWFASIKVAAIIAFIVVGLGWVFGVHPATHEVLGTLTGDGGIAPNGLLPVLAAVPTVFFALTGAEITAVAAGEARDPVRAMTRMSMSVVARILLFYIGSLIVIALVVPWRTIEPGHSPFTAALNAMGFGWASTAMNLVILTATLSCLNSAFYVTSRMAFALAAVGDAPKALVKVNARGVPTRTVWLGAISGAAGVVAAVISYEGVFEFLQDSSGAVVLFIYTMLALSQIRLRNRRSEAEQKALPIQMWLFPWASWAAVIAMGVVLVAMARTASLAHSFWASALTLVVTAIIWYVHRGRVPRQG